MSEYDGADADAAVAADAADAEQNSSLNRKVRSVKRCSVNSVLCWTFRSKQAKPFATLCVREPVVQSSSANELVYSTVYRLPHPSPVTRHPWPVARQAERATVRRAALPDLPSPVLSWPGLAFCIAPSCPVLSCPVRVRTQKPSQAKKGRRGDRSQRSSQRSSVRPSVRPFPVLSSKAPKLEARSSNLEGCESMRASSQRPRGPLARPTPCV